MRQELDLARECRNAERIRANFKDHPYILTPKVYWQWTSERLNVQEYVDGIPGSDLEAVDIMGLDRGLLATRGAAAVLKMIFEDGFFHADPHPGNVFYLPGEKIVFIDFGMMGRLSEQRRQQLVDLLFGFVNRRAERVVDILLLWAEHDAIDEASLANEIDSFIDRLHGVPLKSLDLPALINDLISLLRERQLALPADLSLLTKAFLSLDGMGRQLDPDFDLVSAAEPFLQQAVLARYAPGALARRGRAGLLDAYELLASLPKETRDLIRTVQKGRLRLRIDIEPSERFAGRLDHALGRLTMGILIAALIMGSSIVMTASGGQIPFGLTFFAMLGFFAAVVGGLWLLVSMWSGG
jgi:ubiquinone biosynthesis protein